MRTTVPALTLLLIAALAVPAFAQPAGANSNGNGNAGGNAAGIGASNADTKPTKVPKDEKVAREAVKNHQVLSLDAVTALVGKASTGRVLDVELVRLEGVYAYEVTVLETGGRLHKLYYDARSGALMDDW